MGIFQRKVPNHYIPIHPDNIDKNDWIIVLEAGTIIGRAPQKLRVAKATRERKIVKKYNLFMRPSYYLVVDGFDPRIHALLFCPQLFRYDANEDLIAMEGEDIGRLLASAVQGGVVEKKPWYHPAEKTGKEPVIRAVETRDLDTIVVDQPALETEAAPKRLPKPGPREPTPDKRK
jgi:hypothetical protein